MDAGKTHKMAPTWPIPGFTWHRNLIPKILRTQMDALNAKETNKGDENPSPSWRLYLTWDPRRCNTDYRLHPLRKTGLEWLGNGCFTQFPMGPSRFSMPVPLPCPHTMNTLSSNTLPIKHTRISSWDFSGSGLSLTLPTYITLGKSQHLWASFSHLWMGSRISTLQGTSGWRVIAQSFWFPAFFFLVLAANLSAKVIPKSWCPTTQGLCISLLYWMTNYHKFSDLKQYPFTISQYLWARCLGTG